MSSLADFQRDQQGRLLLPPDVLERFWNKVDRSGGKDACWEWQATRVEANYGMFSVGGKCRPAHRISFLIHIGPIPQRLFVHHVCHNRACCNPAHLMLATPSQNAFDRWKRSPGKPPGYRPTPTKRDHTAHFWRQVDRSAGPDACWPWTASIAGPAKCPHGKFRCNGKRTYAHRFAWEQANGRPVPGGMIVRHLCHNPICQNPAHLDIGTQSDNMRDALDAGRYSENQGKIGDFMRAHPERRAKGERNGSQTHPERRPRGDDHWTRTHPENLNNVKGEDCPWTDLTDDDIRDIRKRRAAGERQRDIGASYGIGQTQVSRIQRRVRWAHVD